MIYEMVEKRVPWLFIVGLIVLNLFIKDERDLGSESQCHKSRKRNTISTRRKKFPSFKKTVRKTVGQVEKGGNGTAGRCDKGHELQPLNARPRMGTRAVVVLRVLRLCQSVCLSAAEGHGAVHR